MTTLDALTGHLVRLYEGNHPQSPMRQTTVVSVFVMARRAAKAIVHYVDVEDAAAAEGVIAGFLLGTGTTWRECVELAESFMADTIAISHGSVSVIGGGDTGN